MKAAEYYSEHFIQVQQVVKNLPEDAASVTSAKQLLEDPSIPRDLAYIRSHYTFLVRIICELESSGKPIYESMALLEEVKQKMKEAPGDVGEKVRTKMEKVLQKNNGLKDLCAAADILAGKSSAVDCNIPVQHVPKVKYAPVTSVDVERSFSAYKLILTDKRHSFSLENLEKVLVIYCEANYGVNV